MLSHARLFVTPRTVAHQAPLSMGFSRQEYWSRLSFPSPEDLPNPGIERTSSVSPALQADSLPAKPLRKTTRKWPNAQLTARASLVAQMVKNPPAMEKIWFQSLGWEDPLEKGAATHSGILAWRIPWTV